MGAGIWQAAEIGLWVTAVDTMRDVVGEDMDEDVIAVLGDGDEECGSLRSSEDGAGGVFEVRGEEVSAKAGDVLQDDLEVAEFSGSGKAEEGL